MVSYDEHLLERIRRVLAGHRDVVEKPMVGGRSFLVQGRICCGVTIGGLMVRVGPNRVDEAVTARHAGPCS